MTTSRKMGFQVPMQPQATPVEQEAPAEHGGTTANDDGNNIFMLGKSNPDPRLCGYLSMMFEGEFNFAVEPNQLAISSPNGTMYIGIGVGGPAADIHIVYEGLPPEQPIILYQGCSGQNMMQKFVRAIAPNTIVGMMQQQQEKMEEE